MIVGIIWGTKAEATTATKTAKRHNKRKKRKKIHMNWLPRSLLVAFSLRFPYFLPETAAL